MACRSREPVDVQATITHLVQLLQVTKRTSTRQGPSRPKDRCFRSFCGCLVPCSKALRHVQAKTEGVLETFEFKVNSSVLEVRSWVVEVPSSESLGY